MQDMLEEYRLVRCARFADGGRAFGGARMKYRHYAPAASMVVVEGDGNGSDKYLTTKI